MSNVSAAFSVIDPTRTYPCRWYQQVHSALDAVAAYLGCISDDIYAKNQIGDKLIRWVHMGNHGDVTIELSDLSTGRPYKIQGYKEDSWLWNIEDFLYEADTPLEAISSFLKISADDLTVGRVFGLLFKNTIEAGPYQVSRVENSMIEFVNPNTGYQTTVEASLAPEGTIQPFYPLPP